MTTYNISLEIPTEIHEQSANELKEEFFSNNEKIIHGSALFDKLDYKTWLIHNQNNRKDETVEKNWAKTTTFFGVQKSDNKIIGMIDIRHNLNNEFLKNYGGHIGYSIRPSERKKRICNSNAQISTRLCKILKFD